MTRSPYGIGDDVLYTEKTLENSLKQSCTKSSNQRLHRSRKQVLVYLSTHIRGDCRAKECWNHRRERLREISYDVNQWEQYEFSVIVTGCPERRRNVKRRYLSI